MGKRECLDYIKQATDGVFIGDRQRTVTIKEIYINLTENKQSINRALNMSETERKTYNIKMKKFKIKLTKIQNGKLYTTYTNERRYWYDNNEEKQWHINLQLSHLLRR